MLLFLWESSGCRDSRIKQYDKHEAETLKAVADGRSSGETDIENVSTSIAAISEDYPELKSDKNYRQFMTDLTTTENLIANYRENYNKQVKQYRRYVKSFPKEEDGDTND